MINYNGNIIALLVLCFHVFNLKPDCYLVAKNRSYFNPFFY